MLVGPGENAGVVDVGDGIAVAIRIESHNHPSAIEPYQGAATGVGGILRDIFTMGARPIALMDPLRFGPLDDARSRWIAEGVVSRHLRLRQLGRRADRRRRGRLRRDATPSNPLVNVLCLGRAARPTGSCSGQATGVGNLAVLLGSQHRARRHRRRVSVLASAGFGDAEADEAKRPSVQVGDPFEEKRLIEACLALLDAGLVVGHPGPRRGRARAAPPARRPSRGGVGHGRRRRGRAAARAGHGAVRGHDVARARSGCWPSSRPADLDEVLAHLPALGGAGHGRRAG